MSLNRMADEDSDIQTPGARPAEADAFCRGCRYHLRGLAARACPECGRAFDPSDPGTYALGPAPAWRRRLTSRWVVIPLMVGLLTALAYHQVLPRPHLDGFGNPQWRLWVWMGRPFGVFEVTRRIDGVERRTERAWWGDPDIATRVSVFERPVVPPDADPGPFTLAWEVRRSGRDRWSMNIASTGVPLNRLVTAFNTVRTNEDLFGVALDGRRAARTANDEPFRASGPKENLLAAIIQAYGVRVTPLLTSASDDRVWVYDERTQTLEELPVDEARERGFEVPAFERAPRFRREGWHAGG
jgi:hypothetical protein